MPKTPFRKKVIASWLISYTLILVVPIILSVLGFMRSYAITSKKINDMNIATLTQLRDSTDEMINGMMSISAQIGISNELNYLLNIPADLSESDHYLIYQEVAELKKYVGSSYYLEDIVLYLKNSGYVISSRAAYSPDVAPDMLNKNHFVSAEQWEYINSLDTNAFYDIGGQLVYVRPFPFINRSEKNGAMVIFLKMKLIRDRVGAASGQSSRGVFIIDNNANVFTISNSGVSGVDYSTLVNFNGSRIIELDGVKLYASSLESKAIDCNYIILESFHNIFGDIYYARDFFYVTTVMCFILGIAGVIFFTKRNYSPVRELMKKVSDYLPVQPDEARLNEYTLLAEAFNVSVELRKKAEQSLADRQSFSNRYSWYLLLNGEPAETLFDKKAYEKNCFAVILIALENTTKFFEDDKLLSEHVRNQLLSFIVENCAQDFFGSFARTHALEIDNCIAVVIVCDDADTQRGHDDILRALTLMHGFFNEKMYIELSAALGTVCAEPDQLHYSYLRAKEALGTRIIVGNNTVIDSHGLKDISVFYDYGVQTEEMLINHIKNGDSEQSIALVREVIHNNISSGMLSTAIAKCMFFDIAGTIIKALSQTRMDNGLLTSLNLRERIGNIGTQYVTLEQIQVEIEAIIGEICAFSALNKENQKKEQFLRISLYIEENYMNPDLNITSLARFFLISTTSIAKIFKENTELTPLDYINQVRIRYASEKLKNPALTLEDIANSCGFGSSHSLIRIFKKYKGVTPGIYREMERGK